MIPGIIAGGMIIDGSVPVADLDALIMALSPFAYYKLDETTGTTFADSSGNGRSLTVGGTVTINQPPLLAPGRSASFASGNGNSRAFHSALAAAFNGDKAFTIESLIKPSALSGNQYLIHVGDVGWGGSQGFLMFVNGSGELWVQGFAGSWQYFGGGTGLIVDGEVAHVAVKRAIGGASKCLINGSVVATGAINGSLAVTDTTSVGLGLADLNGGTGPFYGGMDYSAIHAAALSDAELLSHAQAAGLA